MFAAGPVACRPRRHSAQSAFLRRDEDGVWEVSGQESRFRGRRLRCGWPALREDSSRQPLTGWASGRHHRHLTDEESLPAALAVAIRGLLSPRTSAPLDAHCPLEDSVLFALPPSAARVITTGDHGESFTKSQISPLSLRHPPLSQPLSHMRAYSHQAFKPLVIMPLMIQRCATMKRITRGTTLKVAEAVSKQ